MLCPHYSSALAWTPSAMSSQRVPTDAGFRVEQPWATSSYIDDIKLYARSEQDMIDDQQDLQQWHQTVIETR